MYAFPACMFGTGHTEVDDGVNQMAVTVGKLSEQGLATRQQIGTRRGTPVQGGFELRIYINPFNWVPEFSHPLTLDRDQLEAPPPYLSLLTISITLGRAPFKK